MALSFRLSCFLTCHKERQGFTGLVAGALSCGYLVWLFTGQFMAINGQSAKQSFISRPFLRSYCTFEQGMAGI